jgi:excisionase family DNA binding protein
MGTIIDGSMNTTTAISIVIRHLITALQAIQRDILDAERDVAAREPPAKQEPPAKETAAPTKKLLKLSEAAEFLGVSNSWLYRKTMTREIPFIKLGSRTMFNEERLLAWVKAREHTPDDLLPRSRRRN